jgi:organic hydroperoxide reductase OsmC/OhrA
MRDHTYSINITWTGNTGTGTSAFRAYERSHEISVSGKPPIPSSSDPAFRGDKTRYNPEELLVASLSSCHMLWYLHLCADAGIVVVEYEDNASGLMEETTDGGGHFKQVVLHPRIKVRAGADVELANSLHERAHHLCFIANSVNFPVTCEPTLEFE